MDSPAGPVVPVRLLTSADQSAAERASEKTLADHPTHPVHHYIEAQAAQRPTAVAVTFKKDQLTYEELNQRANQLAHYLIRAGVSLEVRVAVCLKPSLDIAVSLLAILKAGGVYVPLDPTDPADRIATILEDNQPALVLTESYLLQNLRTAAAPPLFSFDRDWHTLQELPVSDPGLEFDLEHTAYLVYTSGTTGKPKGVMASHSNLAQYILSARARYGFRRQDAFPALARFTFSISLFELLSPLVAGGRLLILERDQILNFKSMVQVLEEVSVVHASPTLWRKLLAYIVENGLTARQFRNLRHVSSGGDLVPADLLETMKRLFREAEIFVIYGCSEISCMGCTYFVPRDREGTRVGKPFQNVAVCVFDLNQSPVPQGTTGEIYFSGLGVTKGYLNRADLTEEKFVLIERQRFYRTGDLGRFDPDGNLEIFGRVDFQIQLRGIRIEPGEIEAHLRQAPGVRDGVVVARELGRSEKSLIAYIVLEQTQEIEPIRQYLQTKLPEYMIPAGFVVLEAIPVNLNQKVDRQALPAPTAENLAGLKAIVPPRNDLEKQLVGIWEETLGVQPIGVQSNFCELGGDSLQAVQILIQIEERWNKTLPITTLLEVKTIEALAGLICHEGEDKVLREVVPLRSRGSKPPLFCLHGAFLYQPMTHYLDADQPVYGVFLEEEVELVKTGKYDPGNSVISSIPGMASRYLQLIRSVQPQGPYYLAGYSFGGLIAFEVAHQLQAEGEKVALVTIFDSWMIRRIAIGRRLKIHWDMLLQHGATYLFKRVQRRLALLGRRVVARGSGLNERVRSLTHVSPRRVSAKMQDEIWEQVRNKAVRAYQPRPYSGKVVLFRAKDQVFLSAGAPDLGWKAFASGDLEIYDVPGDHLGILRDPHVSILTRRLQTFLG